MLEAGLFISRFLHFSSVLLLFGGSLYPFYAYPMSSRQTTGSPVIWAGTLFLAAVVGLTSTASWFVFTVGNMAGSLGSFDQSLIQSVVRDTTFGQLWALRFLLSALILAVTGLRLIHPRYRVRDVPLLLLSGALLASLCGTGHAQANDGPAALVHISADGLHLLCAGAWLGGLVPLALLLRRVNFRLEPRELADSVQVLNRFSRMGMIAVALLLASGLINSWLLVGSITRLLESSYGRLLTLKIALFVLMVMLAAANRCWLVPTLEGTTHVANAELWLRRLRRHVLAEQLLGGAVVGIVSILGLLEPVR